MEFIGYCNGFLDNSSFDDPIEYFGRKQKFQIVEYFIRLYEKFDENAAFWLSCAFGNVNIVANLSNIENIEWNICNQDGVSALMISCLENKVETVEFLLQDFNLEINIKDNYGMTALMYACQNGHMEIVKILLDHPAFDTNGKYDIQLAMDYARKNNHFEIMNLLLNKTEIETISWTGDVHTSFFQECLKYL